jgi:hypothetical protein
MQLQSAIHRKVEGMNEIERMHPESEHGEYVARLDTKIHPR